VAVCAGTFACRMFAITGGFHRYFSHRSYKTSRSFQFILAFVGVAATQKGPLWWAANHRQHHRYSDTNNDVHSPIVSGFWWSHVGWILSRKHVSTNMNAVRDLARYPELRFLNRHHWVPPTVLAVGLFGIGAWVAALFPELHTSGSQLLIWGFFISTVMLYHCTFSVNSLAHLVGSRRFATNDKSRNNLWIALITLGEGWHNNHHRYPGSERQGFYWWEIDITHGILKMLSWVGLVWDLREPPSEIYHEAKTAKGWKKAA
ncbi:MAG: acyl-CoA desaturase, partial [Fidelibacterota bacterium]